MEQEGNVVDPRGQGCRATNVKITSLDLCPRDTRQELQKGLEQESRVAGRVYPTRSEMMEAESRGPGVGVASQVLCPALQGHKGLGARDTGGWSFLELWAAQAGFPSPKCSGRALLCRKIVLGRHPGLARGRATYLGALLLLYIIK